MAREALDSLFAPLKKPLVVFQNYTSDKVLVTDLLSKFVITFGTVLIVGGLYLMLFNAGSTNSSKLAVDILSWVPGIPFNVYDLTACSASILGLVTWIIGVDLLVIGLGFWVRHSFARWVGLIFFGSATAFQFIQFIYWGITGALSSLVSLICDAVIFYFLFTRFDLRKKKD